MVKFHEDQLQGSQKNGKNRYNYESDSEYESDQQREQVSRQYESQEDNDNIQQRLNKLQQEEQKIKSQLKQLPYGLILQQKIQLENSKNTLNNQIKSKKNRKEHIKRVEQSNQSKDKNAPKQLSIHSRPHKKVPQIFQPSRPKSIDPRFQDYAGSYNKDLAMKSFDFIPKIQQQEIKELKKTLDSAKSLKKNSRNKKKLSQSEKAILTREYNKLTNERRQQELLSIEQQAKRNIRSNQSNPFIPRFKLKNEFEKVKQSRMSDQQRKEYLKKKEKKIFKNQQVERNNMVFETTRKLQQRGRK